MSDLSIDNSVNFYGFVAQKKKFELLQRAWILVHPSIREGWGLNVIEANACSIPAIGYNVTGLRDSIRHKKTGLLTKKNDYRNLGQAILYLLNNKEEYNKYATNARAWAKTFNWNHAGKLSWELINNAYEKSKE